MALRRIVFASYGSQVYTALVGIALIPVYLGYLGAEAFGLVGFYAAIQAWFGLLDAGMTPAVAREFSRFRAGSTSLDYCWRLLFGLEHVFLGLAVLLLSAGWFGSDWVAANWLNAQGLDLASVAACIVLMAALGGVRLISGFYQGVGVALEEQLLLSGLSAGFATLRSVGVVLFMAYVAATPVAFFSYVTAATALELLAYRQVVYRTLNRSGGVPRSTDLSALRSVGRLAGGVAFLSIVWVSVSQVDRLLLSHYLSLEQFGYFSLAVSVAGGISLLLVPLGQIVQPRLTILATQGREAEFLGFFSLATQLITALLVGVGGTIALFSEPLLWAWTGNESAARQAAPILALYALGNSLVGLLSLAYIFQLSKGNIRLHIVGNVFLAVFWIPAAVVVAGRFGAIGTGTLWMFANFLLVVVWLPFVFSRLAPALSWRWLVIDVMAVGLPALPLFAAFLLAEASLELGRAGTAVFLGGCALLVAGTCALAGGRSRRLIKTMALGEVVA